LPEFAITAEDGCVPLDVLEYIAAACDLQMRRDVRRFYDAGEIWTVGALPSLDGLSDAPGVRQVLTFRRKLNVTGALGFHTRKLGVEYAEALAPSAGSTIDATTASHEIIETFVDPGCDQSWPMPDGSRVDFEAADPVENDSYPITVTLGRDVRVIRVSNFVTPAWFGLGDGPYDFLERLKAPFSMTAGGYFRRVDIDGGESYVYADLAAWERVTAKLANRTSRLTRRNG
jgi:hypothetical protein